MAEIVWTEPALADLDAIADFIAIEDPAAASGLVCRVLDHVQQLVDQPGSGSRLPELSRSRYRQLVELPCRIFYRHDGRQVFLLHAMRSERILRKSRLAPSRAPKTRTRR